MEKGVIRFFLPESQYGFLIIRNGAEPDVFFHTKNARLIVAGDYNPIFSRNPIVPTLHKSDVIYFDRIKTPKGFKAKFWGHFFDYEKSLRRIEQRLVDQSVFRVVKQSINQKGVTYGRYHVLFSGTLARLKHKYPRDETNELNSNNSYQIRFERLDEIIFDRPRRQDSYKNKHYQRKTFWTLVNDPRPIVEPKVEQISIPKVVKEDADAPKESEASPKLEKTVQPEVEVIVVNDIPKVGKLTGPKTTWQLIRAVFKKFVNI